MAALHSTTVGASRRPSPTPTTAVQRQPRRAPRSADPAPLALLVATILDGAASMGANTLGDVHRLALWLHDERHEAAPLAREVVLSIIAFTAEAHRAAETAAQIEAGSAREDTSTWR